MRMVRATGASWSSSGEERFVQQPSTSFDPLDFAIHEQKEALSSATTSMKMPWLNVGRLGRNTQKVTVQVSKTGRHKPQKRKSLS